MATLQERGESVDATEAATRGVEARGVPVLLPALLDMKEAGRYVGFSALTLEHWAAGRRVAPSGFPRPIRIGGRVLRYRRVDLDAWVASLAPAPNLAVAPPLPSGPADLRRRSRGRPRLSANKTAGS